jgi:DNA-binding transcriptional LysR family regulator
VVVRFYTRAAERLVISQQALSQQMTLLERMLGVRLLDRDTRGTRLTAVGERFDQRAGVRRPP